MDSASERAFLLSNFQHYRIVQPRVVFLHGLPSRLSQQQVITQQASRFGRVLRANIQCIGKDFYSAFVEFEEEAQAALIILATNECQIDNRTLRVFYGSTKFCPHYLRGNICRLANCNYAHYYHPSLIHLRDKAKDIPHSSIARTFLLQNLSRVEQQIQRILHDRQKLSIQAASQGRLKQFLHENNIILDESTEPNARQWGDISLSIETELDQFPIQNIQASQTKSAIQQFLDEAERFLSRLIFQTSTFVY